MAKSQMQSRWSPGPLGWLALALLGVVAGLWTWVDAQESAPMLQERSSRGVVIDPSKPWREQVGEPLKSSTSSNSWTEQVADTQAAREANRATEAEASPKDAPFEIYHNGKLISRPRKPLPDPQPLPEPVAEVAELPPPPAPVLTDAPDLRESLPAPVETDPVFELEPPPTLVAPDAPAEEDKEAAVELLHRARELAEQGSFESATWLVLRAQQLAAWSDEDDIKPDQVLAEIQGIQAERAEIVTTTSAVAPVLEEMEPQNVEPAVAAGAKERIAEPEPRREATAPIIVQMPAAPAPIVTRTSPDDLVVPIAVGSLLVACVLIVFMASGGALMALMQRMTRSAGNVTYRLELAGKEGTSLLGPIQIIDNRPAVAPVMMGMPMAMPGTMPVAGQPGAPAQPAEDDIDPRTLNIPDNPMLLPFNLAESTFAEEQARREEEELQRENDLLKHIFDKNVELQDELDKLDSSAA